MVISTSKLKTLCTEYLSEFHFHYLRKIFLRKTLLILVDIVLSCLYLVCVNTQYKILVSRRLDINSNTDT